MLKAMIRDGWVNGPANDPQLQRVDEFIVDVYEYLKDDPEIEATIEDNDIKITVARLKFKDPNTEAVEGGRHHIYLV